MVFLKKLTLLEDLTKEDGFWNDNDKAQRVMKEKKSIESQACHDVPDPIQWNDVCFWNGKEP